MDASQRLVLGFFTAGQQCRKSTDSRLVCSLVIVFDLLPAILYLHCFLCSV